jgi:hypothetical protein
MGYSVERMYLLSSASIVQIVRPELFGLSYWLTVPHTIHWPYSIKESADRQRKSTVLFSHCAKSNYNEIEYFLTAALDAGERLTSVIDSMTPKEIIPVPSGKKVLWAPKQVWTFGREEKSCPFRSANPHCSPNSD